MKFNLPNITIFVGLSGGIEDVARWLSSAKNKSSHPLKFLFLLYAFFIAFDFMAISIALQDATYENLALLPLAVWCIFGVIFSLWNEHRLPVFSWKNWLPRFLFFAALITILWSFSNSLYNNVVANQTVAGTLKPIASLALLVSYGLAIYFSVLAPFLIARNTSLPRTMLILLFSPFTMLGAIPTFMLVALSSILFFYSMPPYLNFLMLPILQIVTASILNKIAAASVDNAFFSPESAIGQLIVLYHRIKSYSASSR